MRLIPAAVKYLAARGIDQRASAKRALRTANGAEVVATFGPALSGRMALVIPYPGVIDIGAPFVRGRILDGAGFNVAPPKGKFRQPPGTTNHLYFDPARSDWPAILRDPTCHFVITEGEIKAMCATEHGIACVAIGGVWSWRHPKNGRSAPIPDLDTIVWVGREVEIVFDSDALTNPDVRGALFALARELTQRGARVFQVPLPPSDDGGKVGLDDYLVARGVEEFRALPRMIVKLALDPGDPVEAARAIIGARFTEAEGRTLLYHAGDFYEFNGRVYKPAEAENADLRATIYDFLSEAVERTAEGERAYRATKPKVDFVVDALKAETHYPAAKPPPVWLDGRAEPRATDVIPMTNGLLDIRTRTLQPNDPRFFGTNALDFAYDPKPPAPRAWLAFLRELWPDDPEAIAALQEFFGLALTPDTSFQKMLLVVGPKRSGKGTMARVLEALVGRANVAGPTLSSLAMNFGLEPLIGQPLAIVADARLNGRSEMGIIAERLLSISGGDTLTVDRKYKPAWSGRFPTRFMILSNELPRFADASGALASRFVLLTLKRSFYGKEDLGLADRLLAELPGIFGWALEGLDRLRKRGHFVPPASSEAAVRELEDLSSPTAAFVREACQVGPGKRVSCADLYAAWRRWSEAKGHSFTTTAEVFGRDLHAVHPELKRSNLRNAGAEERRSWHYVGIALRPDAGAEPGKY